MSIKNESTAVSPTIGYIPLSIHPSTTGVIYSLSLIFPPIFKVVPVTGAANIGAFIFLPNNSTEVSGFNTLCITLIFILTSCKLLKFSVKADPDPFPPIPGTSPAQATPLHALHTLQLPFKFSLASFKSSL